MELLVGVGAVIVFFAEYLDFVFLHFSYGRFGLYGSQLFYHG